MVLQLDPAIPRVWRDPTTLQFGVDPVVAVLDEVTPGLERLVEVLAAGVSETGYPMLAEHHGVSEVEARRLREAAAACLVGEQAPASSARALVLGDNPQAAGIAAVLGDAGLRTSDPRSPALVLLVADRVVSPADHRGWLQRDVPHLPVVVGDTAITIGPLVEPGRTGCLHCVGLHRRDADAAWPAIATQLTTLPRPAPHPLRTASAIAIVTRMVARRLREGAAAGPGIELRVAGDGDELSERSFAAHPDCRCSALPESDWAPADDRAGPPQPTRATASAGRG